jgi:CheY-like chemotaxis protein
MSKTHQVLIIDDEPSVADALRLILEENGYQAIAVATARAGIEEYRRRHFDVMIIDLRLPDMSGLDVLRKLRKLHEEHTAFPAAILITAYKTPQLVSDAAALGATEVLSKPFSPSTLLSAVAAAISSQATLNSSEARKDPPLQSPT